MVLIGHNVLETSNSSQKLVTEILDELRKFEVRNSSECGYKFSMFYKVGQGLIEDLSSVCVDFSLI
ncbi:Uncharacterised protein [Streptococcus pyogenes]|nr:Uncharacterised protein [Streptococcus pyogenes]VHA35967.1 Uncharacterised protein [Streptococcus pyogenes]VHE13248.1 Uncharacterised protein [Streptococcus pyogenes]VHH60623.1 Uncharacterised protein [Streptococcus pyogenes]VHI05798.1 Uncharacterised protein [Streptococcus pyogenes]